MVRTDLKTAKARFAGIHRGRAFIAQSKYGWVRKEEFPKWAECFFGWMEKFREEHPCGEAGGTVLGQRAD
jgi:hypothetical protein